MGVMPGAYPYYRGQQAVLEQERAYMEAAVKRQQELWAEYLAEQQAVVQVSKPKAPRGLFQRLREFLRRL